MKVCVSSVQQQVPGIKIDRRSIPILPNLSNAPTVPKRET